MKRKHEIAVFLSAALTAALLAGCSAQTAGGAQSTASAETQTETSAQTPSAASSAGLGNLKSFKAETLDGGSFTQKNFADKDVTILNFWSLECGPCVEELPEIAKFAKALPGNVQMLTVNLDGTDAQVKAAAGQELKKDGLTGTALFGGDGDLKTMVGSIQYTPTTILVNRDGKLLGDPIIGSPENLSKAYTAAVSSALQAMGKAALK